MPRRVYLLAVGIALVVLPLLVTRAAPRTPVVRALVQLHVQSPHLLYDPAGDARRARSLHAQFTALARSRRVLEMALRDQEVGRLSVVRGQTDPAAWLARSLEVDYDLAPDLMRLRLNGGKPDELVRVLNGVVNALCRASD